MTSTFRNVMLWLSLLIVVFLAWHFAQIQHPEETMAFSDLLASVEVGEVHSVRIDVLDNGPGAVFRVTTTDGRRLRVDGLYSDAVLQSRRASVSVAWPGGSQ